LATQGANKTGRHAHKTLQREATADGKGIFKGWVL